jgi:sec-independent protein translocase protein TatA
VYCEFVPIGPWELLIILLIVLLLFGAKRVPEVGRSLGKSLREFKEGVTSPFEDDDEGAEKRALESGEAPGAVANAAERKRERAAS